MAATVEIRTSLPAWTLVSIRKFLRAIFRHWSVTGRRNQFPDEHLFRPLVTRRTPQSLVEHVDTDGKHPGRENQDNPKAETDDE